MMRGVVPCLFLSLDGTTQGPDLQVLDFDAELAAHAAHLKVLIASQGAVLPGRVTHQEWASYWPTSNHEPLPITHSRHSTRGRAL